MITPEDPYPVWEGAGGPVRIAPLFLLYDYSFLTPGTSTVEASLTRAYDAGIVCSDAFFLHSDPHKSRNEWCTAPSRPPSGDWRKWRASCRWSWSITGAGAPPH